jgi:hypothetical protein
MSHSMSTLVRRRSCIIRLACALAAGPALLCAALAIIRVPGSQAEGGTLTVHNAILGQTTTYVGATEAGVFHIDDLVDLGINTYRLWTKMDELEWWDDDDAPGYLCTEVGTPPSSTIKLDQANGFTNTIPWDWWDTQFTGTYYTWSGNSREQVIQQCIANGITPVLVLRTRDDQGNPDQCSGDWAPRPNPTSQSDLAEWWEHCFAIAYWLNVRHSYGVTHFEVLNEPDQLDQGWAEYGGTTAEYVHMVRTAYDAVKYANDIAGIETHIHAPVVANYNSAYVADSLDGADDEIQAVDYHTYANDPTASIQGINSSVAAHNPDGITETVWVSEWGTYSSGYDTFSRAMLTANQLLTFSEQEVEGVTIFGMYDWGSFAGLLDDATRVRTETYYAYRLMTRGLVGGKERLDHTAAGLSGGTRTMVTRDAQYVYVTVLRNSVGTTGTVGVDMTAIGSGSGAVTVWEYSAANKDVVVEMPMMTGATFTLTVPSDGIALAQVDRSTLAARVSHLEVRPAWPWAALAVSALAAGGAWFGMHRRRDCG